MLTAYRAYCCPPCPCTLVSSHLLSLDRSSSVRFLVPCRSIHSFLCASRGVVFSFVPSCPCRALVRRIHFVQSFVGRLTHSFEPPIGVRQFVHVSDESVVYFVPFITNLRFGLCLLLLHGSFATFLFLAYVVAVNMSS